MKIVTPQTGLAVTSETGCSQTPRLGLTFVASLAAGCQASRAPTQAEAGVISMVSPSAPIDEAQKVDAARTIHEAGAREANAQDLHVVEPLAS
jgi:hypothetical protein